MLGAGMMAVAQSHAALAYMNPGTGSLILQALMIGIAGGYLFLRSSGHQLAALLARRKGGGSSHKPPREPDEVTPPTSVPTD